MSIIGLLQKIDKSMFDNVGEKIKQLARIIIWSSIALSVFASVLLLLLSISNEAFSLLCFVPVVLIVGCLSAWVSFVCIYGFGELIDKLSYIEELVSESSYRLIRNTNPSTPT